MMVIAPPMRVAICADGISCTRLAAVRIAMSPVPPFHGLQPSAEPTPSAHRRDAAVPQLRTSGREASGSQKTLRWRGLDSNPLGPAP